MSIVHDPVMRDRLADTRSRLADLRKQHNRAVEHKAAAGQALASNPQARDTNSEEFKRAERAIKDLEEVRASIALTEQEETYLLSRMAGIDSPQRENFLSDPGTLEELRMLASSSAPIGAINLGPAISRDELLASWEQRSKMAAAGDVTIADTARQTAYFGTIPALRRQLRLLDLIPSSPMDGKSFDYTQEVATGFDTAAETAELAVKPASAIALTDAQVVAKTIAHWSKTPRQQLADVPALGQLINDRLVYGVERRLETQIIGGDGTGENLLGIIHTSGIGAPASVSGDTVNTDLVLNALGSVLSSEADPNAVCLNPADLVKMLKVKAATSGVRLDSPGAFAAAMANLTLWGLPVIPSTAIAAAHALVGDFSRGCRVFIREGVNVRISDSDQDDFIRNRVTALGEGRFGLMVTQPAAFAYVPLSFAA